MSIETLKPSLIVLTIERLEGRIQERFPSSGLLNVCGQLAQIARNMEARADWIGKPVRWLRVLSWSVCVFILVSVMFPIYLVSNGGELGISEKSGLADFVTLLEAGINDVVLIGAAIFFFLTIETRYKRQRALKALHELRSIAHVIDMHQLTKDPHRIMGKQRYSSTGNSPTLNMSQFELRRYLDYCSEMLSLTGKIAAVYVQEFDDGVAMASASELETLTTGLSRKIWQKISILHTFEEPDDEPATRATIEPNAVQPNAVQPSVLDHGSAQPIATETGESQGDQTESGV